MARNLPASSACFTISAARAGVPRISAFFSLARTPGAAATRPRSGRSGTRPPRHPEALRVRHEILARTGVLAHMTTTIGLLEAGAPVGLVFRSVASSGRRHSLSARRQSRPRTVRPQHLAWEKAPRWEKAAPRDTMCARMTGAYSPMSATSLPLRLLASLGMAASFGVIVSFGGASLLASPASAQGLESGVGSGPSEQLSVPPNRRNDPDFTYGTRATRSAGHPAARRHARRAARTTPGRPAAAPSAGH